MIQVPSAPENQAVTHSNRTAPRWTKRFDVYLVDTGRQGARSRVLREHRDLMIRMLADHDVYELSPEHSKVVLESHPELAGLDPLVLVIDSDAMVENRSSGYGFRYCLGRTRSEIEATNLLRLLLRVLSDDRKARDISAAVAQIFDLAGKLPAFDMLGATPRESSNGPRDSFQALPERTTVGIADSAPARTEPEAFEDIDDVRAARDPSGISPLECGRHTA